MKIIALALVAIVLAGCQMGPGGVTIPGCPSTSQSTCITPMCEPPMLAVAEAEDPDAIRTRLHILWEMHQHLRARVDSIQGISTSYPCIPSN